MSDRVSFSNIGRYVFGIGAIALGIIGLAWHDFATVWQPVQALPFSVPREALALLCAAGLFLGGAAVLWRPAARAGSCVIGVVYLIFALFWLPRVIGYPQIFATWAGLLQQFALVAAAMIIYVSSRPSDLAWTFRTAQFARAAFGICVLSFGVAHFTAIPQTAGMVPKWLPPGQEFWALATGLFHVLAGIAILSGLLAVLASRLLTLMLFVFGALVWAPSLIAYPHEHIVWAGNAVNLALAGAAWVFADWIASTQEERPVPDAELIKSPANIRRTP